MKKTFLILALAFSLLITKNSFAQTAGDKAPAKTPATTTEKTVDKKSWTSEDRHAFIDECFKNAKTIGTDSARFYCYCMQENIEQKYPNVEDANKISPDDLEKPEWQTLAKNCLTGIGQWTSQDRADFISECVNAAQDALGKDKAKNYCECMLFKVEKKFPDPNKADLSEETLASPEWKKIIKDCMEF